MQLFHYYALSRMSLYSEGGRAASLIGRRRWASLLLLAALAGCAPNARPASTESRPTEFPSPTPGPTATPTPSLLLIAAPEGFASNELAAWAADQGWGVLTADPEGASAIVGETRVDLQAIVSFGEHFGGRATQIAVEVAPVVLVEAGQIEPGPRLSTVGEPGGRHDQAGFLAGVMVGLAGQTAGWVGLVEGTGGPLEPVYRGGFEAGLRYGCPKCRLVTSTASEATADGFQAQGVQVVFVIPGPAAAEAGLRLAEGGLWLVWVGDLPTADLRVAGRVVFAVEGLIQQALEALLAGQSGVAWPYAIENGGIRLGEVDPQAISPGRQRLLLEAYEAVAVGQLELGIDPITGQEG